MQESNIKVISQIRAGVDALTASRGSDKKINRASSSNSCVRARWYKNNDFEPRPLEWRGFNVFAFGDLVEMYMNYLIRFALGPDKYYSEIISGKNGDSFTIQNGEVKITKYDQLEWTTKVKDFVVSGHPDGIGKRWSDGKWELIEHKSAATFSFDRMIKEGPGDYIKQAHMLMMSDEARGLGIEQVRFFYMNKNTQDINTDVFSFSEDVAAKVVEELLVANGKEIPPKPYEPIAETRYKKPTGKSKLYWKCSYCDMNKHCWPDARIEFTGSGPVYYV